MSGATLHGDDGFVDDPAGLLDRRYRNVLLALAVLALLNPVVVQPSLLRLMSDAPVINIAGRQRMLSQRLAKAALALDRADGDAEARRRREELRGVLELWSSSHEGLRHGNRALSLPSSSSPVVTAAFAELEPDFSRIRDAATRLLRREEPTQANLATILDVEPTYLVRMDRIVGLFEAEARARVDQVLWTGWLVTGLELIGLLAIGWLILRPASRLIARQVRELREARDVLEARVRERTADLERANSELEREARELALAKERHRTLLQQFSQVGRTTTIGVMATGLAHELSQPLGAIANYAEGCLISLDAPAPALDDVRETIRKTLATTLRAGEIVKRIRRFVTRHDVTREHCDPNRIAAEVEEILRDDALRRGFAVRLEMAPELPCIWGDPVQIQQVLVNLVQNAFEALSASKPDAPAVVMRTERLSSDDVEFSVSDNGEGIPEGSLARVFDVYFSTRDEGMGMGLAISRTIVEAHHGRIGVESSPGICTTFRFAIPLFVSDDAQSDGLHR